MSNEMATVPASYIENFVGACHGEDLLEHFEKCGIGWIRRDSRWQIQEPEHGRGDYSEWNEFASNARGQGVNVFPILDYTAPWVSAAPTSADNKKHHPPGADMVNEWERYVARMCELNPDIRYFEVWNEPNIAKFLRVEDEHQSHQIYTDRLLKPAARVLHAHDRKVVAPSFTTEWPSGHRDADDPRNLRWNLEANVDALDRWLTYDDAWRHVDIVSLHYTKGDVEKRGLPNADNLMPLYDHLYEEYVRPGRIDGIWNTEGGFNTIHSGRKSSSVALPRWESKPYSQWVVRYILPFVHWAIEHDWDNQGDYRYFWYKMNSGGESPKLLLEETDDGFRPSRTGRTIKTLLQTLTDADRVGVYPDNVSVGFGVATPDLDPDSAREFTNYAFHLDDDVFVAAWLDQPGIEIPDFDGSEFDALVSGIDPGEEVDISRLDYVTGEPTPLEDYDWTDDGLRVGLPKTDDPVLYLILERR